jgi:FdhE protein
VIRRPIDERPAARRRIDRAAELTEVFPAARELLVFYSRLSEFQESVFQGLARSGTTDLVAVAQWLPDLCALVERAGPSPLSKYAAEARQKGVTVWKETLRRRRESSQSGAALDELEAFFSRVLLQPYAEYLASRGDPPKEGEAVCPFCTARPVVGVLRTEGEGAKRSLICSLCATEWFYRRIVCTNCGEADKNRLPVYKAEGIPHVRVEACDSCHCYLKSVDLTVNGLAVPVVDELATVALNIWAEEMNYAKSEPNLLGL